MKKKIITIAIIGIFLLTSFTTLPVVGIKIISQDKAISENILSANTYDSRGPIEIYGNDDFTEENGVRNPEADGTENDPYIISGWRLPYILVHFTTTYFTISNCYIEDCGGPCYSGIELKEVKNGTIEKCSMSNLYLYQTLRENGITLKNTQNINIKDCNIFAHFFGIECFDSNNNKIRHCDIYGPAYGLFWFNANYNEIYQCKIGGFISSGVCGVNLDRCNNNIIHHCIISKTIAGVNLLDSNGNIFHHNNIFDNYRYNAVVENGENQWDDGISKGNYWDDYNGEDTKLPYGIGDDPYFISDDNQDNYPLMKPISKDKSVNLPCFNFFLHIIQILSRNKIVSIWRN